MKALAQSQHLALSKVKIELFLMEGAYLGLFCCSLLLPVTESS